MTVTIHVQPRPEYRHHRARLLAALKNGAIPRGNPLEAPPQKSLPELPTKADLAAETLALEPHAVKPTREMKLIQHLDGTLEVFVAGQPFIASAERRVCFSKAGLTFHPDYSVEDKNQHACKIADVDATVTSPTVPTGSVPLESVAENIYLDVIRKGENRSVSESLYLFETLYANTLAECGHDCRIPGTSDQRGGDWAD